MANTTTKPKALRKYWDLTCEYFQEMTEGYDLACNIIWVDNKRSRKFLEHLGAEFTKSEKVNDIEMQRFNIKIVPPIISYT